MCSICGGNYPLELVKKASDCMAHRGPDFSATFSGENIALAHNRLSIIDLDSHANQPFISSVCPHLVLLFNGEIYNYLELQSELKMEGFSFFTQSDTEVLLYAFAHFGEKCLQKLNGDFAFVVYDKRDKSLFLARDRLGNKPLFYALSKNRIFFASEIKAFLELGDVSFDDEEVAKWLLFSNGDGKKTIYKDILPFPHAHFGWFRDGKLKIERYWDLKISHKKSDEKEVLEELESLLLDSLKLRLRSDVPMALCVSGGVDSSILAHLTKKLNVDCQFFGISFRDFKGADESAFIKLLQKDLDCEITLFNASLDSIKKDFSKLVFGQDEIFRSFSIYLQYLLFREIAKTHKVVLDGQGADELFGGYYHYVGRYIYANRGEFENRVREYGNVAFSEYDFGLKCSLSDELKLKIFKEDNAKNVDKLIKMGLSAPSMENLLRRFLLDFTQGLYLDTMEFNLPNLLRYGDRNAMIHSMENRTPFTDFRVVEFAFSLSENLKINKGFSKYILRLLLDRLGSKSLAWRKDKVGFGAPERDLMQKLGYNFESIFDVRVEIFRKLGERL